VETRLRLRAHMNGEYFLTLQGEYELMLSRAHRDSRVIPESNDRLLLELSVQ
jgi:hypothetical protein